LLIARLVADTPAKPEKELALTGALRHGSKAAENSVMAETALASKSVGNTSSG
jgi:hypothetical protein